MGGSRSSCLMTYLPFCFGAKYRLKQHTIAFATFPLKRCPIDDYVTFEIITCPSEIFKTETLHF